MDVIMSDESSMDVFDEENAQQQNADQDDSSDTTCKGMKIHAQQLY